MLHLHVGLPSYMLQAYLYFEGRKSAGFKCIFEDCTKHCCAVRRADEPGCSDNIHASATRLGSFYVYMWC